MFRFGLSRRFARGIAKSADTKSSRSSKLHKHRRSQQRHLAVESLEVRRLLAIDWVNEFGTGVNDPGFGAVYGTNTEAVARAIVNRAIEDWELLITNFNFAADNDSNPNNNLNNTHKLKLFAAPLAAGVRGETIITAADLDVSGKPTQSVVRLDNDGGGLGWFFDQTPFDDVEFTSLANSFQASFVDSTPFGQSHLSDFYRTVLHEIGHAMGIIVGGGAIAGFQTFIGTLSTGEQLFSFSNPSGPFGVAATFTDSGHLYEGPPPANVPNLPVHPNELMNAGRTVPAGQPTPTPPIETTRQFISDLTVKILADAYGYAVTLPSSRNTAHAMLDSVTGTLLVQGRARNFTTGAGVNDTITLQRVIDAFGDNVVVNVNGNVERIPYTRVLDIIIHGNGGTDTVTVNANVVKPWQQVQYMVSSNQDALESAASVGGGSITDGIVDLSSVIPGSQTTLRAAVREANASGIVGRTIYLGRGLYYLTLPGNDSFGLNGDLDITGHVKIIGAGAERTVIHGNSIDRVFDVNASINGQLDLARVTVTGGRVTTTNEGGGIRNVGDLILTDVHLLNNVVTAEEGGGIYMTGGSLTITRSLIAGNSSGSHGAGIYVYGGNSNVVIVNSTISNNVATSASSQGGGIWIGSTTPSINITHSTIAYNQAGTGGGMFRSGGDISVGHSIFANNVATLYPDYRGAIVGTGYNLIENTSGVSFFGSTTGNITGLDPVLGPLAFNGGIVATHALLTGSPAIDAGNPSVSGAPATDQRFAFLVNGTPVVFARIADGDGNGSVRIDIGAHERQPTIFGILSSSLASSGVGAASSRLLPPLSNASQAAPIARSSVFERVDQHWIAGELAESLVKQATRRGGSAIDLQGSKKLVCDDAFSAFAESERWNSRIGLEEVGSLLQTA